MHNNQKYLSEESNMKKNFVVLDGSRYEGSWIDNRRNGFGRYKYANGDIYEGDWYEHRRHGQGTYTYKSSAVMYKGDLK